MCNKVSGHKYMCDGKKLYHDNLKETYWSSFLQSEILPKQESKLQSKPHGCWFEQKQGLHDVNKNIFAVAQ